MTVARLFLLPMILSVAAASSRGQQKPESKTTPSPAPSPTAVASPSATPTAIPKTPSLSSAPEPDKIYSVYSEGIQRPQRLKSWRTEPTYPEKARKKGIEGVVVLEVVIGRDGIVGSIKVLKSVDPLLDAAAKEAVEQWRYRPATLNGEPVPVRVTETFTFHLH